MEARHVIAAAASAVLALGAIACSSGGEDTKGPGAEADAAAKGKTIVFEVTGAKKADVTYGLNVDQSQENDAKVPWKKSVTSKEDVTVATVVAASRPCPADPCGVGDSPARLVYTTYEATWPLRVGSP